jgi:pyridoxamine 5'-phosphate oxidase
MADTRPDLAALRRDYQRGGLGESEAGDDPRALFDRWLDDARAGGVLEANAMVLATVDPDGQPSARAVLLKGVTEEGFVFYTNHDSRKGRALAHEARCALTFVWLDLQRQVRVEGRAHPVPEEVSDAYFATRPRDSQLGAWASTQSSVVRGRDELEQAFEAARERFGDGPVPRPPYWGGYVVRPERMEFWQGRHGRMHDRLAFTRAGSGWDRGRLAP